MTIDMGMDILLAAAELRGGPVQGRLDAPGASRGVRTRTADLGGGRRLEVTTGGLDLLRPYMTG
jgi:hypothetical protein